MTSSEKQQLGTYIDKAENYFHPKSSVKHLEIK
jgi:hypothetical protein